MQVPSVIISGCSKSWYRYDPRPGCSSVVYCHKARGGGVTSALGQMISLTLDCRHNFIANRLDSRRCVINILCSEFVKYYRLILQSTHMQPAPDPVQAQPPQAMQPMQPMAAYQPQQNSLTNMAHTPSLNGL